MQGRLQDKVALVTGAFGGIGSAITRRFLAEGAAVIANDLDGRPPANLRIAGPDGGERLIAHRADHSKESDVVAMMQRARELFGGVDILVNNAFAAFEDTDIETLREEDWDHTLSACLKGPFLCTKHAVPLMKERGGGSIVSISSVNALRAVSETAYTAAKGGLISMMRLVAADFAEWNIRSNVICPGTIATSASLDYWEQFPAGFAELKRMYPLGRIGDPVDIANYVLFLASDESNWVTGTVHAVDGGLMAGTKLSVR
ncbi:MAG: SDR family oxidoreductase [Acidobacteriia bacterium]|nr:SDR family oxidoreductase [Terriglobia bacterium]MYC66502.1 SDR family oxidoreductase [Terriglobia bacterium]